LSEIFHDDRNILQASQGTRQEWHLKHLLKKLVIPVMTCRPISSLATRLIGDGIPIFMLHRLNRADTPGIGHTPSFLRRCLDYLGDNDYKFVSVEAIFAYLRGGAPLPSRPVAFTMDDGFIDQATLAAPIFIEYSCPLTIFLITGMLDGKLWPWFDQVDYAVTNTRKTVIHLQTPQGRISFRTGKPEEKLRAIHLIRFLMKEMEEASLAQTLAGLATATQIRIPQKTPEGHSPLSWEMARDLENKGIQFGPHTVSHRILSRLDSADMEFEITASWQRLQDELASPCPVFCYPNGTLADFGYREIETVKKTGLVGALSSVPTQVDKDTSGDSLYRIPRLALPASFDDFVQYCSWIQHAKEKVWRTAP
jgi:peptidoglycan/xylan/chitin deacetylase (PgdA/CDA1 family)